MSKVLPRRAAFTSLITAAVASGVMAAPTTAASASGAAALSPGVNTAAVEAAAGVGVAQQVKSTIMTGTIKGPAITIPRGNGWAANPDYGSLPAGGTLRDNIATMQDIEDTARNIGVPWADADNPTDRHNVYHIYGIRPDGSTGVWKYGITKEPAGSYRPTSQLTSCRDYMRRTYNDSTPQCDWLWLRKYTSNFMRARRVEAAYFTEYKLRTGKCPPGATSCL